MLQLNLNNERLRELIPNVIHEVKGERPLYDKLVPWLDSATAWLDDNFIGKEFYLSPTLLPLAEKIVVAKAFAEAIPSLDVALTPAGFSVINTDGRAPASKERIERLVQGLNSSADANSVVFLKKLMESYEWRDSHKGLYWTSTCLDGLDDVAQFRRDKDLLTTYRSIREHAVNFERLAAEEYLGSSMIWCLRRCVIPGDESCLHELWEMVHAAELRYISYHIRDQKAKCPDQHEMWHLMRPIIAAIQIHPAWRDMWDAEMAESFEQESFKNSRKGGYFF